MLGVDAQPAIGAALRWATLSQVSRLGVQLLTIAILARTLTPAAFGLVTMAVVVTGFVALFRDLSVGSSVIHRGETTTRWLSTQFWLAVCAGFVVTTALMVTAPLIAAVYREPELTAILMVLSVSFAITGFGVVHQAILERDMRYRPVAHAETIAALGGSVAAIAVAFQGAGVWSLVVQVIVSASISTVAFWLVSTWRPKFSFNLDDAKSGGAFGAGLTTFNIANYVSRNADYFVIGRALGPAQLGFYAVAYRLMLLPLQVVSSVVNRVMFPNLAKLRGDRDRFRDAYLTGVGVTAFASFPIGLGMAAIAPRLIPAVLGPGWEPAIPVAVILSFVGVMQSMSATVGPVFLATGSVTSLARWGIISAVVVVAAFLVGLPYGIVGVAVAYLVATALLTVPVFLIALQPAGFGPRYVVAVIWRPALIAVVTAGSVGLLGRAIGDRMSDVGVLAVELGLGILCYASLSLVANRSQARMAVQHLWNP